MRTTCGLRAALVVVLVGLFWGPSVRPVAAQAVGSIGGRVLVQGRSGTVTVCAWTFATVVPCTVFSGAAGTATAAADGKYNIPGLPAGPYWIVATIDEYPLTSGPKVHTVETRWYDNKCGACRSESRPVPVVAGQATAGIDIDFGPLSATGAIEGEVTGDAAPSIFAGVDVFDSSGALVRSFFSQGGPLTYRVEGLLPGVYYAKAADYPFFDGSVLVDSLFDGIACTGLGCDVRRGTPIRVFAGATTSDVNFHFARGGAIAGSASERFGGVSVYDSRGALLRGAYQLKGGPGYSVNGLPAGVYYLTQQLLGGAQPYGNPGCGGCAVTSGTPVVVRAGETTSGINFPDNGAHMISGTVREAGSGAPIVTTVEVFSASEDFVLRSTLSDPLGHYVFSGVHPGRYAVRATATGYQDQRYNHVPCGQCGFAGSTPVVVSHSDISGIDFDLARGTSVRGSLRTRRGFDVPDAPIVFRSTASGGGLVSSTTDKSGAFDATLGPGSYWVSTGRVSGLNQAMYRDLICTDPTCQPLAGATPVAVAAMPVSGIDLVVDECTAPTIAPLRLALASVGIAYRQVVTGAGGVPPFGFTVRQGTLPDGLSLNTTNGELTGTPTVGGHFSFTLAASDSTGCVGTRAYFIEVASCVFDVSAPATPARPQGEAAFVSVARACGDWTAASTVPWIRVLSSSPSGVAISIDPNTGPTRSGIITVGPRVATIWQSGVSRIVPFGAVDTPADNAAVSGSVAVSGWALDDARVTRVAIYRDPVAGEGTNQVFIGQATFVPGARPDIERIYLDLPSNRNAGWGYLLLTNMLPNGGTGTYRLHAYADDADGATTLLGSRTIVGTNNSATLPFGALDTPGQGEVIAGPSYVNFGWALTPKPQTIPTNGSTIQVVIDGVTLGTITYNLYRSDVTTLFPSYNNSAGPVGYRVLDTTSMEEGLHTIAWVVTDDGGRTQGIGSRYFEVRNSAWSSGLSAQTQSAEPSAPRAAGIDLGRRAASLDELPLGDDGVRVLRMRPLDRIELDLARESTCAATYAGYSVASGETRELPVGSSLDASAGAFAWAPGPGFIGAYDLVFVRTGCDGARERVPVRIVISAE